MIGKIPNHNKDARQALIKLVASIGQTMSGGLQ
jgi:hypothetical protein